MIFSGIVNLIIAIICFIKPSLLSDTYILLGFAFLNIAALNFAYIKQESELESKGE